MKRFLILVLTLLFIAGCESGNQGYGYSVKTTQSVEANPVEATKKKSTYWERWDAYNMYLYDKNGKKCGSIQAYKAEYDGKKWYVFLGSDGRMTVVEDTGEN